MSAMRHGKPWSSGFRLGSTPEILDGVPDRDSATELEHLVERYNDAWNAHDLDTILSLHAPGMVFENHTAGERAEGDEVRPHIAAIFENWPDLMFSGRRLYARDGLVVSEWTATATAPDGRRLTWDGVDVFPFENGLIVRKDVYSAAHRARTVDG
jgi:ketosteroid isomerase-like protein